MAEEQGLQLRIANAAIFIVYVFPLASPHLLVQNLFIDSYSISGFGEIPGVEG